MNELLQEYKHKLRNAIDDYIREKGFVPAIREQDIASMRQAINTELSAKSLRESFEKICSNMQGAWFRLTGRSDLWKAVSSVLYHKEFNREAFLENKVQMLCDRLCKVENDILNHPTVALMRSEYENSLKAKDSKIHKYKSLYAQSEDDNEELRNLLSKSYQDNAKLLELCKSLEKENNSLKNRKAARMICIPRNNSFNANLSSNNKTYLHNKV